MIKRTSKHTIYEVWNEWAAESVYFTHKPSKKDVREVILKKWKTCLQSSDLDVDEFSTHCIIIEKLFRVYEHVCECGMCKGGVQ